MDRQRIAIIGSGISGLTSAYLLNKCHDITVFEANDYIGGHTHTVPVDINGRELWIDTGFIVCNDRNYPNFLQLMSQAGINLQATEMSFSVSNPASNLEYNGHNLNTLFAQRRNLLRPRFIKLVRNILRFNSAARSANADPGSTSSTLGEFVESLNLGEELKEDYLYPMVAAIWSCSTRQASEFPLQFFLKFFLNHGLLDIKNRPQWYVLQGGSHSYINPLIAGFRGQVKLDCKVQRITRRETGVSLHMTDQDGEHTEKFDQVIIACHSDQALRMLSDPTPEESAVLGAIGYQENDVILHSDASIMPKNKRAWASWNFLAGATNSNEAPVITYCMNILQGLTEQEPLLVTLNGRDKIAPDRILQEFSYSHPVYSTDALMAQTQRNSICGSNRTHYCGAYWYNGFHEDGVRSALDVCARFGTRL